MLDLANDSGLSPKLVFQMISLELGRQDNFGIHYKETEKFFMHKEEKGF